LIIRLANYSVTTSLIYNKIIRRYLGFQYTASSGGFSDKTLKEARLYYRKPSLIRVPPP